VGDPRSGKRKLASSGKKALVGDLRTEQGKEKKKLSQWAISERKKEGKGKQSESLLGDPISILSAHFEIRSVEAFVVFFKLSFNFSLPSISGHGVAKL
jgi:hypothetical protein